MAYSKGFFSPSSNTGHATDNEKATTEDAAYLAGTLEALEKRVTQIMKVKMQSQNTAEVADCENAIQQLEKCRQEVLTNAQLSQSPRPM
ncbi:LigB protein (part of the Dot/Icm secretion system) [Legionella gratiana]|uniref:LigB protein (Part of the Dot/Icm secretion system) n=1 Tax=Legionella gratiana TaxID=45066 RepID=Q49JE2_9GAMM|nr:hypothetical protein [Legionella gratiana]AAX56134.1 unknown [Legionella gratiana]KTD05931.1 LigB protein (part of the Dot/Icm secretion system) [Legionella gratiana]STX42450.1 LigB protein (part of the Dot/Icm secretion system) [Legionella gratiana]